MDASKKSGREVSVEASLVFDLGRCNTALLEANGTECEFEEAAEANLVERSQLYGGHVTPIRISRPAANEVVLEVGVSGYFGVILVLVCLLL